jgi:hypothetical protein
MVDGARISRSDPGRRRFGIVAASMVFALLGGLVTSALGAAPADAAVTACSASSAQNGITVAPSHGSVFYIDSAASQRMDAAYLGYVVTSSTARADLWVGVSAFSGGSVGPADPNDTARSIGALTAGGSKTAYFLAKAGAPTTRAQSHLVTVYSGMPELASSTVLATCTFTFTQVKETIKANSNKVTSVVTSPASTAGMTLGQTFTVTVEGDTGVIGDGTSSPDRDMMWLSPAARSSWPAGSVRLESSRIRLGTSLADARSCTTESTCQFTDVLLIRNLKTVAEAIRRNTRSLSYVATYTFRVVGATSTAVPIIPAAQIASGTQIKHTTIPATALATIRTNDVVVSATASKSVSTTVTVTTDPLSTRLRYTLRVANTGASAIAVDRLIDDADPTLSYVPGSVVGRSITAAGAQSALAVREPSTSSTTGDLTFSGPLAVPAGGRIEIDYTMATPTCVDGEPFSVTNSAIAEIGVTLIGTSASTFQQVLATGTCGDTVIPPPIITDEVIPPEVVTLAPSAIGDTTATLEGTADPNGVAGSAVRFEWGTDPAFQGSSSKSMGTTTSATTPQAVSGALTGLQSGTTYYYRLVVDVTSGGQVTSYAGARQSFTTTEPVGSPVVTTLAATGVSTSGATLNATIDPNQTSSFVAFSISKTATLPAASTTTVVMLDDPDLAYNATSNPYTAFGGSFSTPFSLTLAQAGLTLAPGDTWYYRADIVNSSGAVLSSGSIRSVSLVTTAPQSVAFDPVADTTVTAASTTARAAATSGLPPAIRTETPSVCRVDSSANGVASLTLLGVGDCTLVAEQDGGTVGGTVYEPASADTVTFAVGRAARSLALDAPADLADWAAEPPHLEAVPSDGTEDGTVRYRTVGSADVCAVDPTTGLVEVLGPGTCSVAADITAGARYDSASSETVSFSIGRRTQQLDLADSSVSLADGSLDLLADSSATSRTDGMGAIGYALVVDDENTAGCSIVGSRLTVSSVGTCLVEASRSGNASWTAAVARAVIRVSDKAGRAIELRVPRDGGTDPVPSTITDWGTGALDVVGVPTAADAADVITYSTLPGTTACTVDPSTGRVTITGAGDCVLRTSVGETATRTGASSASATIRIGPRTQSITDFADRTIAADDPHVPLTSGTDAVVNDAGLGEAQYAIAEGSTDGCAVVNGHLVVTQAGVCLVTASRVGNAHWTAAEALARVTVERASRSIAFDPETTALTVDDWAALPHTAVAAPTAGAGDGAVRYRATSATGACTVDPVTGLVEFHGAGSCTLDAEVGDGARYAAARAESVTLTVGKREQSISGLESATRWATTTAVPLAPSSNATRNDAGMSPVALALLDDGDGACRLVDGDLVVDAAGSCTVEASRPGNDHWTEATSRATLTFERVARTIALSTATTTAPTWAGTAPGLVVRISADPSGGAVRYATEAGSACSVDAVTGELTLLRAGTCTVTSTLGASARYSGATAEPLSFTIDRETQRISNLPSGSVSAAVDSLTLAGLSSATRLDEGMGAVTYRAEGACSVDGARLLITAAGDCTITASREGNDNWTSAVAVSRLRIDPVAVTAALRLSSGRTSIPVGQTDRALLTTSAEHPGARTWTATSGICTVDLTGAVRGLAPGTCVIVVSIPSTERLTAATARLAIAITTDAPPPPPVVPTPPPPVVTPPSPTPVSTAPTSSPAPTSPPAPVTQPEAGSGAPTELREPIGVRSIPELAREAMRGFAPGSTVQGELSGARTVGQFVIAPEGLDEVAVLEALRASIEQRAGGFAVVRSVTRADGPPLNVVDVPGPAMTRLFAETRLGAPVAVGSLPIDRASRWVEVVVDVSGLRPASRVALAVTTDPIIVGDALVRADGTATVTGSIPLDLLEAGPHSLRVAGFRDLGELDVDEAGVVRMTDAIIAAVTEFDAGTVASMTLTGTSPRNDIIVSQRRVVLDDVTPWWSLALLAAGVLAVGAARVRRPGWGMRGRVLAAGSVLALLLVVLVAGWYAAAYGIYGIGAALAAIGLALALAPRRWRALG